MAVLRSQTIRDDDPPPLPDDGCFPLLKLPAEMRLIIYRICLKRDEPILLHMPRPLGPVSETEEDNILVRVPLRRGGRALPAAVEGETSADLEAIIDINTVARRPSAEQCTWSELAEQMGDVNCDPLIINILRLNKQVYNEARSVLYSDNDFAVRQDSALYTLTSLHQRSRSLIKQVHITIHSHHDILDGFADLVRLGLRYCWGLEMLHLKLTAAFPEDGGSVRGSSVYANAFHILRWLPKSCKVRLEGKVPAEVERIIRENERNAETLDEKAYLKRQHQMPDKRFKTDV